jgi:chromosome segregation ATPase
MECIENYHNLKGKVDEAVEFAENTVNYGQARQKFINIQNDIKGKNLKRDQREELYQTIRDNFEALNSRQEKERDQYLSQCNDNYEKLRIVVDEAIEFAKTTDNYSDARQRLINAQGEIKGVKLTRDQRDKLYGDIREIFTKLNEQQSGEREEFEKEASENYEKLTKKINDAFELVHGVTDFRLIREVLIAIQGEVKILRLKRDQRNELFGRIREAFGIFDKKKDEFFSKRRSEKAGKLKNIKSNLTDKLNNLEKSLDSDKNAISEAENNLENISDETKNEAEQKLSELKNVYDKKQSEMKEIKERIEDIDKELNTENDDNS